MFFELHHVQKSRHVPPLVLATTRGLLRRGTPVQSKAHAPYMAKPTRKPNMHAFKAQSDKHLLDVASVAHEIFWHITRTLNSLDVAYPHFAHSKPVDWNWTDLSVADWTYTEKIDGTREFLVCLPDTYIVTDKHGIERVAESGVDTWIKAGAPCVLDTERTIDNEHIVFDVLVWNGRDVRTMVHADRIRMLASARACSWRVARYRSIGGVDALRQLMRNVDERETDGYDGFMLYDPMGTYACKGASLKLKPRWHMTVDLYIDADGQLHADKRGALEPFRAVQCDTPTACVDRVNEYYVMPNGHLQWRRCRHDKIYPNTSNTTRSIIDLAQTRDKITQMPHAQAGDNGTEEH